MTNAQSAHGLSASELEPVFQRANVLQDDLDAARSVKAKSTRIGAFLSPYVDRVVDIEHDGRCGTATLRCDAGRSRKKFYWFEIKWDVAQEGGDEPLDSGPHSPVLMTDPPSPAEPISAAEPTADVEGGNQESW